MRWKHAQPQGRARQSCEGHTVSVVDRTLYILFGKHEDDCGNVSCPPLTMFDTDTCVLSTPLVDVAVAGRQRVTPSDREGHSAAVIGERIFVFGGTWCVLLSRAAPNRPRSAKLRACRGSFEIDSSGRFTR
jgi:hypothetical protein